MKLFIGKEKFAGIMGYENAKDFEKMVGKKAKNNLTTDTKVNQAYQLIQKHSRLIFDY